MADAQPVRRAALTALAFVLVLTLGVFAVLTFLGSRPLGATNRCVAVLPDGSGRVLDVEQADNAALIAAIARTRGLPARAVTIALATALQESKLSNIDYGDRDSLGLFQQRPSQGWGTPEQIMDPVHATNAFYDELVTVAGYEDMAITVAAQAVQRSAYPEAYARHEDRARAFASALSGHSAASLTCDLDVLDDTAAPAEAFAGRLQRDWGTAATVTPWTDADGVGWLVVPATTPDATTAAWSVGQWAVATADATGVSAVVVGERIWQRGAEGWQAAAPELVQPPGSVLVR